MKIEVRSKRATMAVLTCGQSCNNQENKPRKLGAMAMATVHGSGHCPWQLCSSHPIFVALAHRHSNLCGPLSVQLLFKRSSLERLFLEILELGLV